MRMKTEAGGVSIRVSDGALHVGERRIPRSRIKGVELDRGGGGRGSMIVTGETGIIARIDFHPSERAALAQVEKALAPRRTSLRLFLDQEAYLPGDLVRGSVELDWPRTSPVRGVRVGMIGAERTRITVTSGSGKNRTSRTYREYRGLVGEERDLFGGPPVSWWRATGDALGRVLGRQDYPLLRAGKHRYEFAFRLPDDAPPSFEGTYASVCYEIYAHVDIPLSFDLRREGVISVAPPEGAGLAPLKGRAKREGGFLKADVEMKIDVQRCPLVPGERLRGRILVRNRSAKKIRGATIRLLGIEEAEAEGRGRRVEHEFNEGYLKAPDPSAAEQDVSFEIPVRGPFPYEGRYSRLGYVLEASLDTALAFDTTVRIPLEAE